MNLSCPSADELNGDILFTRDEEGLDRLAGPVGNITQVTEQRALSAFSDL